MNTKRCRNQKVRKPMIELTYQLPFILHSFSEPVGYHNYAARKRADLDERIFRTLVNRILRNLNKRKSKQTKPIKI